MKNLLLLALVALSSFSAQAAEVRATDPEIPVILVESRKEIPQTGDLAGYVVSAIGGSLHGFSRYFVAVDNAAGNCEDDYCLSRIKMFEFGEGFVGQPTAIYSRKIDKNTYSIAIMTSIVENQDNGDFTYPKAKILIRVKFTAEGVSEVASYEVVKL